MQDPRTASEAGPPAVRPSRAVRAALSGPDWVVNALVGGLLLVIPILGMMIVQGWISEIVVRLHGRHPRPVPRLALADIPHYLDVGVPPFLVTYVWNMLLGAVLGALFVIVYLAMTAGYLATESIAALLGVGSVGAIVITAALVVGTVGLSAVRTRAELDSRLDAAFSPAAALAYGRATWRSVVIAHLWFVPLTLLLALAGLLACGVGLLLAWTVIEVAGAHLRLQIYEKHLAEGGGALESRAPAALPSGQ